MRSPTPGNPGPAAKHAGLAVPAEQLRRRCDPASLHFASTAEVAPLDGTVGQPRAVDAISFALDIQDPGYNLFVLGPTGTGRRTTLHGHLQREAARRPSPPDWIYLFDMANPRRPIAVSLAAGDAVPFARDMARFVTEAGREIARAFESDEYRRRAGVVNSEMDAQRQAALSAFSAEAQALGLGLQFTPAGILTVPVRDGRPLRQEEFEQLPPEEQEAYRAHGHAIEERLPEVLGRLRALERETRERVATLDREVAVFAIGHLLEDLRSHHAGNLRLDAWFDALRADMLEHLDLFRGSAETEAGDQADRQTQESRLAREAILGRYAVNVLVSNQPEGSTPVVDEPTPTYYNLFGRIEYNNLMGVATTDHRNIRPGALHRANGGFLVLRAEHLLGDPFAWERLKETLRTGQLRVENIGAQYVLFPTATLDPEPIPVSLKVVLVGPAALYQALYAVDEEFRTLFKVRAEFDVEMPWGDAEAALYASFVAGHVAAAGLRHFAPDAVARVVERGARIAEHQGRLSTRFSEIVDLLTEASYWAGETGHGLVLGEDVDRAVRARAERAGLAEDHIRRLIAEGTLRIDTRGRAVGQVNGLAVLSIGDHAFGQPIRITATTGMGHGEIVHVDRETDMSGRIHTKGFLIASAFLAERYGQERPLSIRASVAVEQSYEAIEGDSASLAEVCALLSSLADVPVRQGIAVTGSMDQHGAAQPVGGLNEKIEGFFRACRVLGLTGDQGVILPESNVRNCMLDEDVLDAVRSGTFHVWAVRDVDEALELLTGIQPGRRGDDGRYPEGTLHRRVDDRLALLAEQARRFAPPPTS